jgi:hypothetical protein
VCVISHVIVIIGQAKHVARDLLADHVDLIIAGAQDGHEAHATVVAHIEDTVGCDRMEMDVEIERTSSALYEGYGGAATIGDTHVSGNPALPGKDPACEDLQDL